MSRFNTYPPSGIILGNCGKPLQNGEYVRPDDTLSPAYVFIAWARGLITKREAKTC